MGVKKIIMNLVSAIDLSSQEEVKNKIRASLKSILETEVSTVPLESYDFYILQHKNGKFFDMESNLSPKIEQAAFFTTEKLAKEEVKGMKDFKVRKCSVNYEMYKEGYGD